MAHNDPYAKVQPGSPVRNVLSATAINALIDAARAARGQRLDFTDPAGPGADLWDPARCKAKNATADSRPWFSVYTFGAPLIRPGDNLQTFLTQQLYSGGIPLGSDSFFCIALDPLADKAIGDAINGGIVPARLVVRNPGDAWATTIAGDTLHLATATSGSAKIVWRDLPPLFAYSGLTNAGGLVQITIAGAAFATGATILFQGTDYTVTLVSGTTYTLDGSTFGSQPASGTVYLQSVPITNIAQAVGSTLVQVTAPGNGLSSGDDVEIDGAEGTPFANGEWTVTVIDTDNFTLNGSVWDFGGLVYDSTGAEVTDSSGNPLTTGTTYLGGGTVSKVCWALVDLSASAGASAGGYTGAVKVAQSVVCNADGTITLSGVTENFVNGLLVSVT